MTKIFYLLLFATSLSRICASMYGHIRSPLARAVYTRMLNDEEERQSSHEEWYHVDTSKFSEDICSKYVQSHQDEETQVFLDNCYEKSDWLFTQIFQSLAKAFLGMMFTGTSANGIIGRGSMFVFSNRQFQELMGISEDWKAQSLLDLGAGDGKVTEKMASHFKEVYVTEVSTPMVWRLQSKDYKVLSVDSWNKGNISYDVISMLNLLDRCDLPLTLLRNIKVKVKPDSGRIIIALVLPFKPFVENNHDNIPTERLILHGDSLEEQVISLIQDVFTPMGLEVLKFTRLPYLCEGDLTKSFYVLHDVVFVLKRM